MKTEETDFIHGQYAQDTGGDGENTAITYDPYGYYNEAGEYIYYQYNELEVTTDQGVIKYQEMEVNGQTLLVDNEGRILNPVKLQGVSSRKRMSIMIYHRRTQINMKIMKFLFPHGNHNEYLQ